MLALPKVNASVISLEIPFFYEVNEKVKTTEHQLSRIKNLSYFVKLRGAYFGNQNL